MNISRRSSGEEWTQKLRISNWLIDSMVLLFQMNIEHVKLWTLIDFIEISTPRTNVLSHRPILYDVDKNGLWLVKLPRHQFNRYECNSRYKNVNIDQSIYTCWIQVYSNVEFGCLMPIAHPYRCRQWYSPHELIPKIEHIFEIDTIHISIIR